ncbi:MAG: hypothetical protein ACI4NA_02040 [Succinivibrio sp.]
MINTVSDIRNAEGAYSVSSTAKASAAKKEEPAVAPGAASVVELQGSRIEGTARSASGKVSSASAASLAGDIASALSQQGGSVQARISGFDAARLLSD